MAQAIAYQLYQRLDEQGRLTSRELDSIRDEGESTHPDGLGTEWELACWLGRAADCPAVDLHQVSVQKSVVRLLPGRVARALHALALYVDPEDQSLVVAMYDPLDVVALDRLRRICKQELKIVCAPRSQLLRYLEIHYGSEEEAAVEKLIDRSRQDVMARQRVTRPRRRLLFAEYEEDLGRTPIEQLVEAMVRHAVTRRATDIHITCSPDKVVLKHRVDGMLRDVFAIPREIHRALISRLKLAAGMDITSRRLPQDGNIEVRVKDKMVQVRTSVFPTIHGEDIALRLFNQAMYQQHLSSLGLSDAKLRQYEQLLDHPKGLLLVTGPVGVGKTTTLYASLSRLVDRDRRVITLEDPVECRLNKLIQSQISPQTGYDFPAGLRSVLRMDPDVLMVGEIRDVETARMSLRASLTGVLVLSTLHTDRAAGAIPRLLDMEIEAYLLTSSLRGVVSQALVRRVCPECRGEHRLAPAVFAGHQLPETLAQHTYWRGAGCERCEYTGYLGRTGVFELLMVDDAIRDLVIQRANRSRIEAAACQGGMQTMFEDALEKARQGVTSFEEVMRIMASR